MIGFKEIFKSIEQRLAKQSETLKDMFKENEWLSTENKKLRAENKQLRDDLMEISRDFIAYKKENNDRI